MATRPSTPSSSLGVLAPTNSLKRALSEDADSDGYLPDPKKIRLKSETPQAKDKKKRRKKKKKTPVVVPLELPSTNATPASSHTQISGKGKRKAASAPPAPPLQLEVDPGDREVEGPQDPEAEEGPPQVSDDTESSSATIARLNQELSAQSILLKKHEITLAQFNQSLTCQVCLDLLHKPYALAPCGHIACYNCLVAWFTSEPEEQHFGPRKKTCPNCRATIKERPVEVWNIKELVAGLLRSGLISGLSPGPPLPPALPGPAQRADTPQDPWHNIFRYPYQHPRFHPPLANGELPSVEDMGMLDMEDGGVYRCLDCMHEIWDGICTSCHREYPGHRINDGPDEDGEMFGDSDGDEDPIFWPHFLPMHPGLDFPGPGFNEQWWHGDDDDDDEDSEVERAMQDAEDGYDSFIDDEDDDEGGVQRAAAIIEIDDSDSERGSSPPRAVHGRRAAPVNRRVVSSDDEDADEVADGRSRRSRAATRVSSPEEGEVIVVSDDESDAPRRYTPHNRRSTVQHIDLDEDESQEHSDDESTISSNHNPNAEMRSPAELVELLRQFADADGYSEDEHSGSYSGDGW
ncbi:hypothetical protein B0H13DRAFT_2576569 [Mycena leptocephala]|nr:hypothetical protein B0H13DRAFT_2576569 [Mycena leptocephala]